MGFQVSPGVEVKEIDLTNIIPAVSTSIGAFAGYFKWGPIGKPVLVSSEKGLANVFSPQGPTALTAESFFTASSFLQYGNALKVVRAGDTSGASGLLTNASNELVTTIDYSALAGGTFVAGETITGATSGATAEIVTDSGTQLTVINLVGSFDAAETIDNGTGVTATADTIVEGNGGLLIENEEQFENLTIFNAFLYARYAGALGNSLQVDIIDSTNWATNSNSDLFDNAPSGDEVHILVTDSTGLISGAVGTVLEKWDLLQTTEGAQTADGANNYYFDKINQDSNWIHIGEVDDYAVGSFLLRYGADSDATEQAEAGNITEALELFIDVETIDVNLIFSITDANGSNVIANKVHEIAYTRKDAMALISPPVEDSRGNDPLTDVLDWYDGITVRDAAGSYAAGDSSAVYVYDKYRDKFLWIGSQGITAGLCANTDNIAEPWFSPAGLNRGSFRGVVKLAYNPKRADRDELYKKGINPIVSFPGQGIILYGDKTLQAKPSAFDRINVRRLFIVLEKAISTAAKFQLFELNDEFTRAAFRNSTEPFLRDVKGRRGVTDFFVVCDETNNTGEVIDSNRFVADIYIKPARSINFITLNFIATRTGVDFNEIIGLRTV
jgi:phage tail sheath protein FI